MPCAASCIIQNGAKQNMHLCMHVQGRGEQAWFAAVQVHLWAFGRHDGMVLLLALACGLVKRLSVFLDVPGVT